MPSVLSVISLRNFSVITFPDNFSRDAFGNCSGSFTENIFSNSIGTYFELSLEISSTISIKISQVNIFQIVRELLLKKFRQAFQNYCGIFFWKLFRNSLSNSFKNFYGNSFSNCCENSYNNSFRNISGSFFLENSSHFSVTVSMRTEIKFCIIRRVRKR